MSNPFPGTRLWNLISQCLSIVTAGGHPVCTELQSLDLLQNWIKASQSDSSCAGLHVWDALLKLGSRAPSSYKGGQGRRKRLVLQELLRWGGSEDCTHGTSRHQLRATWTRGYIWKVPRRVRLKLLTLSYIWYVGHLLDVDSSSNAAQKRRLTQNALCPSTITRKVTSHVWAGSATQGLWLNDHMAPQHQLKDQRHLSPQTKQQLYLNRKNQNPFHWQ